MLLFCLLNKDKKKGKEPPEDPRKRLFTREELRKYDGTGPTKERYIACNELVFDVTDSDFY